MIEKIEIKQPEEYWLVINLECPTNSLHEKCFEIAYKLLIELESKEMPNFSLKSFHYFFEKQFVIRIEVEKDTQIHQAKKICEEIINKSQFHKNVEYDLNYKGEWNYRDAEMVGYGAAWLSVKNFFDASCRFKLSTLFHKPISKEANNNKLIHCFLNQQGTTGLYKEIVEYFNLFWKRFVNYLKCEKSNIHLTNFVNKNKELLETLAEISSLIEKGKFEAAKEKYEILKNKPKRIEILDI